MDLVFNTEIDGYFKYKIYRNTPDNIIYESPVAKNLILNSGLSHLFTKSVEESIKVVDFGISNAPPNEYQTGIAGGNYSNSVLFTDLSALNCYSEVDYENSKTTFRSFFRTPTSLRPLQLREFAIKPDAFENAFSRQLITVDLSGGDGIEFYYDVEVRWPCGMNVQTVPIEYRVGNEFNEINATKVTFPSSWTSLSGYSNINWTSIIGRDGTLISVASADTTSLDYKNNIAFSNNNGLQWYPIRYTTTNTISTNKFNDIAYGFDESLTTYRYVAVGPNSVAFSNYSVDRWDISTPYQYNNWTGITFGNLLTFPYTGTFVAVSDNGSIRAMKSTTGQNWTSGGNTDVINSPRWSAITYGPIGGFVAVALSGTGNQIAYSKDATTWTAANSPETNNWRDIAYGNGRYIAISNDGESRIMYAEESNLSTWLSAATPYQNEWTSIEYGDGLFVAIASGGSNNAMFSRDGQDWFNVSNIDSKSWTDLTYTGNQTRFFTAIASNEGNNEVIGRASYKPASYPVGVITLSSSLIQIPVSGHLFNQDNILYTLSSIDLRTKCLSTPYLEHVNYSTGFESSSFAESTTTQIFPNSACSTYTFNHLSGYGPIKGGIITTGRIQDRTFTITDTDGRTFTDILSGTTNGVYAFQWDVPKALQGSIAATGPIFSPYFVTPQPGSLVKPLLQEGQNPNDLKLELNVCHTWGPLRQVNIPENNLNSRTNSFKIPITTLKGGEFIPIDISTGENSYIYDIYDTDGNIYPVFLYDAEGNDLNPVPEYRTALFSPNSAIQTSNTRYPQPGATIAEFETTFKMQPSGSMIVYGEYLYDSKQDWDDFYAFSSSEYPEFSVYSTINYDTFLYSIGTEIVDYSRFNSYSFYPNVVPELIFVFYNYSNKEIVRSNVNLYVSADYINNPQTLTTQALIVTESTLIPSWKSFIDLANSYPRLNNTPAITATSSVYYPSKAILDDDRGVFNRSLNNTIIDETIIENALNNTLKNYYNTNDDIITNVAFDNTDQSITFKINNDLINSEKIARVGLVIKDYFKPLDNTGINYNFDYTPYNEFIALWDYTD